jgi:hypothetical protein
MRKKIVVFITIFVIIAVVIHMSYSSITYSRERSNVFGEIYYGVLDNWRGRHRFLNVNQWIGWDHDFEYYFLVRYDPKYLDENKTIDMYIWRDRRIIGFILWWDFHDTGERILMRYGYCVSTRVLSRRTLSISSPLYDTSNSRNFLTDEADIQDFLERHNLTMEELSELHHWFLFERIVVDWLDGNSETTRFSIDDLGDYTFELWSRD